MTPSKSAKGGDGSTQDTALARATSVTSRFVKSFFGQITAYMAGLAAAVVAFRKLHYQLHGLPQWAAIAIIFAFEAQHRKKS